MKPKFLFICPTKYYYIEILPEDIKYHILSLMSHIDDLADIELVDFELMFGYPRSEEEINSFLENARSILMKYSPDMIGISCYTSYDYICTVDLLKICNDVFPQALLIVGGYHPTAVPEDFVRGDIPVNFIIRGEGENALRDIIIKSGKDLPVIIQGKPLVLSKERPMRYDLYPCKTSVMSIILSRGCPHSCSFCVQSDSFESPYRSASIEQVKDKMERAAAYYPIRRFLINDPFFGVHTDTAIELLEYFKAKFPKVTFWAETRIDTVKREWFKHIYPLELDMHFGVESLAADTIELMQKTKVSQYYNESFFKAVEMCQEYQVLGLFGFIMNFPGELFESYNHTIYQMKKAVELYKSINFTLHCNQYSLFPGNKIYDRRYELAESRGFSFPNDGWWRIKDPNILKKKEQCYASSSIMEKYGARIDFWADDMLKINKELMNKYTYKAYSRFEEPETKKILSHFYKNRLKLLDNESYYDQAELITRIRFIVKDYFRRYDKLFFKYDHAFILKTFSMIYKYSIKRILNSFLKEYEQGVKISELFDRLQLIKSDLDEEYAVNTALVGADEKDYFEIKLFDILYRINADGTVLYRDKQEAIIA